MNEAKAKYSVCLIVRNCAEELERCLKSFAAYPDEIVIVNTGITEAEDGFKATNDVARDFGCKIYHFPWVEDFSAARNFAFSKCSHDVVMWLDSDDTVENPSNLDSVIRQGFGSGECECLYVEYLYDFDKNGKCTTLLTRERVVDRRNFEWRAPIHEVLCENFRSRGVKVSPEVARIVHHQIRDDEGSKQSLIRNLRIFEYQFGDGKKYVEERMVFYWANTLMGLRRFDEALRKYLEYIPRSGSEAEIQQAMNSASECARLMGKLPEAKALAHQAIERNPDAPSPYWLLAQAHLQGDNLNLAVHYALRCLELANQFEQEMVSNPKIIFGGAALLAATAKYKQNKFTEVEALLDIAAKYYTEDDESIKEMRANVREAKRKHKLIGAFNALRESLEAEGKTAEVRTLATSAPSEIADAHEVARYVPKKRPTDKPTIAFLCGGGMAGGWGPELLKTGIGGSEEAVCYLAEQFVQKGWHVEVYAETKRQQWHGIEWYPTSHFSGDSDEGEVDALVVWRDATQLLHFGVKAKRTYLWLHDMPNPACWMPGLWDAFDGIFVLSNFHGEQHGFIPTEKKVLTGNGLPVDRLVPLDQLSNDPKRMIYASDPTRGLATVLEWWDFIREKVPGAELDVYYGFHPTLMAAANGRGPHARYLRSIIGRVNELKDQPGVNWKGFVGQDELHAGMAKCGLWLYPTTFPEISCITGMKMQAHGVWPVTVDEFAMAETVRHGFKAPKNLPMNTLENQKVWADKVVELALNPPTPEQRLAMAKDARETFDWSKIANQWIALINQHGEQPRFYPRGRMDLIRRAA